MSLDYTKSFIEEQFPISKLSKESYRERKAGASQTLTGLGKWWGRKPLVLVRATVLGSLLPVSENKDLDKQVFLELMGMSPDSLLRRKTNPISPSTIYNNLDEDERIKYFECNNGKITYKKGITKNIKDDLQIKVFNSLSYDDKISYCTRAENLDDSKYINWNFVNEHLQTTATNLTELVQQLSIKRFGHTVKIGDCFTGGGSNTFEPARLGCDVYASDLNPVAGLLSWANLNILGCTDEEKEQLMTFQDVVFDTVTKEIDALKIEQRPNGDVAKFYLYCNETICPECGWKVPLLPSYIVSKKTNTVVELIENPNLKSYDFKLNEDLTSSELKELESKATVQSSTLVCPHCSKKTSINSIRGGEGSPKLRKWGKKDWKPLPDDIFTERLYAIKYVSLKDISKKESFRKKPGPVTDATFGKSYYCIPDEHDLKNESIVEKYLEEHFDDWQEKGYTPSQYIDDGYNSSQPKEEKGWQYWHQLFNPRQLLFLGLLNKAVANLASNSKELALGILMINKSLNWNCKLGYWEPVREVGVSVFVNQALNTLFNYSARSTYSIYSACNTELNHSSTFYSDISVTLADAKDVNETCDLWVTDPPYADAVNYHELSEFFSSWDTMLLKKAFPDWYTDSKRALAIKGVGKDFNESMVEVYTNLANHMPDNGMQVVMFTHQDTKVWAELAMILWSAGLQVTSAWCIQTETESGGLKSGGNYVQGTVLMVLRKQTSSKTIYNNNLYAEIKKEVKRQIDSMRDLDKGDNPDFGDSDYLLAAYVAALKVLTSYKKISGIDVKYELDKARDSKTISPVTNFIEQAKKIAYDYLVPSGISSSVWRDLISEERFYLKGFELELNGDKKMGTYQEIARGFGVSSYESILASKKANEVRVKTPSEYKNNNLGNDNFGKSLLRHILKAVEVAVRMESALEGRNYLKAEYDENNEYWVLKEKIVEILTYLGQAKDKSNMVSWVTDVECVLMLREAINNDTI